MTSVTRDKYNKLKLNAEKWREKALEFHKMFEINQEEIENLNEELNKFKKDFSYSSDKLCLSEKENKTLNKEIRNLTKKLEKYDVELDRQLMRKDIEIDRLKASLEDIKERYKEIRDDNKELRKINRIDKS